MSLLGNTYKGQDRATGCAARKTTASSPMPHILRVVSSYGKEVQTLHDFPSGPRITRVRGVLIVWDFGPFT